MRIAYNSAMTAFAPPAPGQLTPSEEAQLPGLIAGVLAAESPREEMLKALDLLIDKQQFPALAARLFESVVWRTDLRHYWIYYRMARAYMALGPTRADAAYLMAALGAQTQPDWSGSNLLFADMFSVLSARGTPGDAVAVFLAAADITPERPPAEPYQALPVFAAAGIPLPGSDRPRPRADNRRNHRVIELSERPAWTCPVVGGGMPAMLRRLAEKLPRPTLDVAELRDAEVLLCSGTTVVLDREGAVHADLSVSNYPELVRLKLDRLSASATPPRIVEVPEAVVISDRFPPPNLCHFLLDQITRLDLYQRAGVDTRAVSVIGPEPEAAFQHRILRRAGVAPERVIGSAQIARVRVKRLWVSSNCVDLQHAGHLGAAWAVQFARATIGGRGQRGWRRLYISRGDVAGRRVTNEDEVIALLEPLGFEVIQPGKMSYDAQVAAFRQASHVIGPHGAALTHLIVCPLGAHILEIFHPLYGTSAFAMQVAEAGVNYTAMLARDFQYDSPDWNDPERGITAGSLYLARHLRVELDVLRGYLASVL